MSESTTYRPGSLMVRLSSTLLAPLQRFVEGVMLRGGCARPRHMVLVESLQLGNRRQLFLVACDEQRFLVGAGNDRIGTLVAVPESLKNIPVAASNEAPPLHGTQIAQGVRGLALGPAGGRRPGWMARTAFERAGSRGLELVRKEAAVDGETGGRTTHEAGKTR